MLCDSALKNHRVATCKSENADSEPSGRKKYFAASQGFRESGANEGSNAPCEGEAVRAFTTNNAAVLHVTQQKLLARDPSADITDRAKQCVSCTTPAGVRIAHPFSNLPSTVSIQQDRNKGIREKRGVTRTSKHREGTGRRGRWLTTLKVAKIKLSKEVRTVEL